MTVRGSKQGSTGGLKKPKSLTTGRHGTRLCAGGLGFASKGLSIVLLVLLISTSFTAMGSTDFRADPTTRTQEYLSLADQGSFSGTIGPVSFEVSGASYLSGGVGPADNTSGEYTLLVPVGTTVTITVTINPDSDTSGYFNMGFNGQNQTGIDTNTIGAQTFSNSKFIADSYTYAWFMYHGTYQGHLDYWGANLDFRMKPSLTFEDNAPSVIDAPTVVSFFGRIEPRDLSVNLSIYRDGGYVDSHTLYGNDSSGNNYQFYWSVDHTDQNGTYDFVATAITGTPETDISKKLTLTVVPWGSTPSTTTTETTSTQTGELNGVILDPFDRAVASATVDLYWSETDPSAPSLIATTTTDSTGRYAFADIQYPMQGGGYLEVTLDSDHFAVEDNSTFSASAPLRPAQFDYPVNGFLTIESASDLLQNIKMSNVPSPQERNSQPSLPPYEHAGTLAAAYVNTYGAFSFWTEVVRLSAITRYHLPIVLYSNECYCMHTSDAAPYITINEPNPENIPNSEYHEVAHYAMFLGFGGEAYFSRPDDSNHGGFSNPDSKDSWIEGFAEFFGQVSYNYAHRIPGAAGFNGYDSHYTISQAYVPNFQNNFRVNASLRRGATYDTNSEEFAVASILWAIYSPIHDGMSNHPQLSVTSIWSLLSTNYSLYDPPQSLASGSVATSVHHIETMSDLYDALTSTGVVSKFHLSATEITGVFWSEKVLEKQADGSPMVGLDNPSGGPNPPDPVRAGRRHSVVPYGSNIVVNSDPASLPYSLTLKVIYAAPYEADDYTISVPITQPTQTVDFWLPDPGLYNATGIFVASKPGMTNTTVESVNNADFWNAAGGSETFGQTRLVSFKMQAGNGTAGPVGSLYSNYLLFGLVVLASIALAGFLMLKMRSRNRLRVGHRSSTVVFQLAPSQVPQATFVQQHGTFCRNCGSQLRSDSRYCESCGAKASP